MVFLERHLTLTRTWALVAMAFGGGVLIGRSSAPHASLVRSETADFYNYISFDVKPERREDFLKSIYLNERDTMALEPAARAYQWGEDVNVPNRFHFHEQYAGGLAGFQAHLDSEHVKQWNDLVASEPFTAEPNGPHLYSKMDGYRRGQIFF